MGVALVYFDIQSRGFGFMGEFLFEGVKINFNFSVWRGEVELLIDETRSNFGMKLVVFGVASLNGDNMLSNALSTPGLRLKR